MPVCTLSGWSGVSRGFLLVYWPLCLPVVEAEMRVIDLNHHQAPALHEAAGEAIAPVCTTALLDNQQHGRALRRHQLAQGCALPLGFLLQPQDTYTV